MAFGFMSCDNKLEMCVSFDTEVTDVTTDFLSVLFSSSESIGSLPVELVTENSVMTRSSNLNTEDTQIIYLSFSEPITPAVQGMVENVNSIYGLVNLSDRIGFEINRSPRPIELNPELNPELQMEISAEMALANLLPLVGEARQFLKSNFLFTNQDIENMLIENDAHEVDLVLLVMEITATSGGIQNSGWYCLAAALGVNALWSMQGSSATKWTKQAIKVAFRSIARKAKGPIGAGIAVVVFGLCMGGVSAF